MTTGFEKLTDAELAQIRTNEELLQHILHQTALLERDTKHLNERAQYSASLIRTLASCILERERRAK